MIPSRTTARPSGDASLRRGVPAALAVAALLAALPVPPAEAADARFRTAYETALALFDEGSFAEALAGFERAYRIEPLPEPLYMIARCYLGLRRFDEAVAGFDRFLAAAPAHEAVPLARDLLIDALRAAGESRLAAASYLEALTAFQRALEVTRALKVHSSLKAGEHGRTAFVLAGLGEAQLGLGRRDAARASFEEALDAAPPADLRARLVASLARLGPESAPAEGPAGAGAPPGAAPRASAPATSPSRLAPSAPPAGGAPESTGALATPDSREPREKRPVPTWVWGMVGVWSAVLVGAVVIAAVVLANRGD